MNEARHAHIAWVMVALGGCGLDVIPRSPTTGAPPPAAVDAGVAAPMSGAGGLVIGGRAVPRDKVIVFLRSGHSNMAGRAETPESERSFHYDTHPQLWAYARGGVFRPAKEPLSPD